VARLIIAIQLMALALRLPFHFLQKSWRTQAVLLTVVLCLMWLSTGFMIYGLFSFSTGFKFSIWESLLMGACLAPTDAVVASAVVQSALALKLVPARVRHTITAESGFNDGTGYPLVIISLRFVMRGDQSAGSIIAKWFVDIILDEIVLATVMAVILGYVVGKLLVWAEPAKLHDQQLLVALTIALAFAFVGGFQLLSMDALLTVAVGGVMYALVVEGPKRGSESQLQETVDLIFSSVMFILFGLAIPFDQWHDIVWWRGILLAIAVVLFRRIPWVFLMKPLLARQLWTLPDVLFTGYFGPIGVGAIYYALFVAQETGNDSYWVVISFLVFSQVVLFGMSDTALTMLYARTNPSYKRRRARKDAEAEQAQRQIENIQHGLDFTLEHMDSFENVPGTQLRDLEGGLKPASPDAKPSEEGPISPPASAENGEISIEPEGGTPAQ